MAVSSAWSVKIGISCPQCVPNFRTTREIRTTFDAGVRQANLLLRGMFVSKQLISYYIYIYIYTCNRLYIYYIYIYIRALRRWKTCCWRKGRGNNKGHRPFLDATVFAYNLLSERKISFFPITHVKS